MKKTFKFFFASGIILALAILILGKFLFSSRDNFPLFIYGVSVTTFLFFIFLVRYTKYKDPSIRKKSNKNSEKPFISCVLAVYNEEKIIGKCIDSLLNSTYKNKEIIVVNDSSSDSTKKVLENYASDEVKIINLTERKGKKKAIAEGLKIAKGEIFVFTDSDSIVAPDAIEKIIEVFIADPSIGAVSGHGRALNANENIFTKIQDSWYETQYSIEKAFESSYGSVTCVSGPLAVFRRAAIYNYIPAWINDKFLGREFRFATDRQLTGYVLGNKYQGEKLKARYSDSPFVKNENYPTQNWKIVYCNSAHVWTNVPNTFGKIIKQQVRWKKSFIRNLFFTGRFYWKKPLPVALKYYIGAILTLVGPFIALRHLIYLPLVGNLTSGILYLSGILLIGSIYAVAFKLEDQKSPTWKYRPLMSVISTTIISWLLFYSLFTIRRQVWHRG